jgi:hypothetical protein
MRHAIPLALACTVCISTCAAAVPLMKYSWDDCNTLTARKDFAGPAVYTQTISGIGLNQPINDFELVIGFLFDEIPPAWMFSDLCSFGCPFNCQPAGRVSLLLGGTACDTLPGFTLSAHYWFKLTPGLTGLTITGTASGPFTPDPAKRYTLARIAFDHASSVSGPGGPGTCGGAQQPFRFRIGDFYLNGADQRGHVTWENCIAAWNSDPDFADCPLIVPVKNRTWGQIKSFYR